MYLLHIGPNIFLSWDPPWSLTLCWHIATPQSLHLNSSALKLSMKSKSFRYYNDNQNEGEVMKKLMALTNNDDNADDNYNNETMIMIMMMLNMMMTSEND